MTPMNQMIALAEAVAKSLPPVPDVWDAAVADEMRDNDDTGLEKRTRFVIEDVVGGYPLGVPSIDVLPAALVGVGHAIASFLSDGLIDGKRPVLTGVAKSIYEIRFQRNGQPEERSYRGDLTTTEDMVRWLEAESIAIDALSVRALLWTWGFRLGGVNLHPLAHPPCLDLFYGIFPWSDEGLEYAVVGGEYGALKPWGFAPPLLRLAEALRLLDDATFVENAKAGAKAPPEPAPAEDDEDEDEDF